MIKGIDVSHHNGYPDFAKAKAAGIGFVYVKATEGRTYTDPNYQVYAMNAAKAGIPFGFYHFARPDNNNAEAEADHFVSKISAFKYNLIPVLDLEVYGGKTGEALYQWALTFINRVRQKTGHKVMLYTGLYYLNSRPELKRLSSQCPLWIAAYRSTAPTVSGWDWTVWQYTESGNIPGVGTCDVNYCRDLNQIMIGGAQVQYYEDNTLPLSVGSKGELVKKLQARLGIEADGYFGEKTKQAVINFQKAHGLTADGIVGQKTWDALFPPMRRVVVDGKAVVDTAYVDLVLNAVKDALTKGANTIEITRQ